MFSKNIVFNSSQKGQKWIVDDLKQLKFKIVELERKFRLTKKTTNKRTKRQQKKNL